jgi:hypothetical protein
MSDDRKIKSLIRPSGPYEDQVGFGVSSNSERLELRSASVKERLAPIA